MEAPKKTNSATITWQIPLQAECRLTLPGNLLDAIGHPHALIFVRRADGTRALRPVRGEMREQPAEQMTIAPDGTITFPFPFAYGVDEGTPFALTPRADGDIELRLIEEPDPDQVSYWGKDWEREEREVDANYAAGRYKTFDDLESFLADLDADLEE
jgi:hypothetical protein